MREYSLAHKRIMKCSGVLGQCNRQDLDSKSMQQKKNNNNNNPLSSMTFYSLVHVIIDFGLTLELNRNSGEMFVCSFAFRLQFMNAAHVICVETVCFC